MAEGENGAATEREDAARDAIARSLSMMVAGDPEIGADVVLTALNMAGYEVVKSTEDIDESEDVQRLLAKAVEHLRYADEAYWDEPTGHLDQHIAYAQAVRRQAADDARREYEDYVEERLRESPDAEAARWQHRMRQAAAEREQTRYDEDRPGIDRRMHGAPLP